MPNPVDGIGDAHRRKVPHRGYAAVQDDIQAYNALHHNRRRSVLTIRGMAWGIATVVLLLAYGTGFRALHAIKAARLNPIEALRYE